MTPRGSRQVDVIDTPPSATLKQLRSHYAFCLLRSWLGLGVPHFAPCFRLEWRALLVNTKAKFERPKPNAWAGFKRKGEIAQLSDRVEMLRELQ
jgi:hypothetical protein